MFQKQPPEVFYKKGVLKNFAKFTGKYLCQSLFFNKVAGVCNSIKKGTLAQLFSCEFCEIFKNIFLQNTSGRLLLYVSGNPDPALGVAQEDCTKDAILGKDGKAWSVYVDSTRSWFQHNNAHLYRSEGGIDLYCFFFPVILGYEKS